ncbi:MAG: hypothetical protein QME64_02890, partial [bacterium]|nr:hypothetical protein [bacterium]
MVPNLKLFEPNKGTAIASDWGYKPWITHNMQTTGWYTITVRDYYGSSGGCLLCLLIIPGGATSDGEIISGETKSPYISCNIKSWKVLCKRGDNINISATAPTGSGLYPRIRLYSPDGTLEVENRSEYVYECRISN